MLLFIYSIYFLFYFFFYLYICFLTVVPADLKPNTAQRVSDIDLDVAHATALDAIARADERMQQMSPLKANQILSQLRPLLG